VNPLIRIKNAAPVFDASGWIVAILFVAAAAPIAQGVDIISNGPVSYLKGSDAINPRPGTQGSGPQYNSLFYVLPGMGDAADCPTPENCHNDRHAPPNQPFFIAYEPTAQPVQTSDWWAGIGLQWYIAKTPSDDGWAKGYPNGVILSQAFISEPFYYQFVDFTGANGSDEPPLPHLHGLRLWNQNAIAVKTDGIPPPSPTPTPSGSPTPTPTPTPARFDASNNIIDRADLAPQVQAVVTVGLENVHPLGTTAPTSAPWTKVKVRKYSDWGAVLAYRDGTNEMEITMANGSPFTWFQRTQGQANFLVWTGGSSAGGDGPTVWQGQDPPSNVLGVTVSSPFNPDNNIPTTTSKAAYLVIADQGTWARTNANSGKQSLFRNSTATKVVVLAMPHNIRFDNTSLQRAANDLISSACWKVTGSRIDYPPITGSQTSVDINGDIVTLGYSQTNHQVALQLRLDTQPFFQSCGAASVLQLLFPHHSKSLHPGQRAQVDGRYIWNSIMGPLRLYRGSSFVQLIDAKGFLPLFPDQAVQSNLLNPLQTRQLAVDDIYQTMRKWFYLEEFQTGDNHIGSFVRNIGTYDGQQFSTYEQGLATLIESLTIADQLANSTKLRGNDNETNTLNACLCKPKTQVAAEMRDYILQALKELVGQWADVYTAQFMQYNPSFHTTYGFPAGYHDIQNLNDKNFHYGYFLRAAAAIGRYDRPWLDSYLPLFEELRKDVANYNRNDTNYPFLRNFSPFYGHNWANGTSQGGADQESTSEAINFAAGLIELGLLLGNNEWRDMGMYMYEQEILAAEQYWFNQDATLPDVVPRPPVDPNHIRYNGNWPEQFVTFKGPDNGVWHTTLGGILNQRFVKRETFFGGVETVYFIHQIPMSASTLYFGRNQAWLQATWKQYLLDTGAQGNPNFQSSNENFMAAWQARMPDSGQDINGTGLLPALTRIARQHPFQFYGTDTMAKYWAYTNSLLGQMDTSIVADISAYGVFKDSGANSSYVAYNPTNQPVTAIFKDRVTNSIVATFTVPALSIASKSSGGHTYTFKPSQITPSVSRLYLGPTASGPLPLTGQLTSTPGSWLPPAGTSPYPRLSSDLSTIMPSLSIVPKAMGQCADLDLPGNPSGPNGGDATCRLSNKAYAEWTGKFSGNLVGTTPFTQMTIYTDPSLHIGWEQDHNIASNTHVRIEYYFTNPPHPNPDRVEVMWVASAPGNSFVMLGNKLTPYYFNCYSDRRRGFGTCNGNQSGLYGLLSPVSFVNLDNRFDQFNNCDPTMPSCYRGAATFPGSVTCGTIKVQVYGQAGPANDPSKVAVPVSAGTSPLLNRPSWVQPPYDGQCAQ
jgi:hypothetical protein